MMKKTIRIKLFLFFIGFLVSFIIFGTFINTLFLEKFYVYKNRGIFDGVEQQIKAEFLQNRNGIEDFIGIIDRLDGINISITDKKQSIIYSSFPKKQSVETSRLPIEIEEVIGPRADELQKSAIYTLVEKQGDQAPKLLYVSRLTSENLLIMTKPIKGIRESSDISNQFYILAGLFMVLIGSILIYILSKKMTKPIEEMSAIAENIANLDFEQKVAVTSGDEIGGLAKSINTISEKLKISIQGLKQDIEFQKELARNMSHELKTPIGVIKGYAEGLLYGVADDQEMMNKYCRVIVDECDRMDNLVKELLNLSMLESKDAKLEHVMKFKISLLVDSVMERLDPIFKEHSITCQTACKDELEINGDFELLGRALTNMVMNAIKYCDENKYIRISVHRADNFALVSVYNTGPGIPQEEIGKIWDVFYKVDKARSRKFGGHGLGLSIVKSIIQLHGGTVAVENRTGGVEFSITLPL
jgi:two-component system sensor histidine kinase VanS